MRDWISKILPWSRLEALAAEEMLSLMSTHVRAFLKEADIFLRDYSADKNRRGLVSNAQKNTHKLFSKFSLDATAKSMDFKSVARIEDIQDSQNELAQITLLY